jgi:hypothetical protein
LIVDHSIHIRAALLAPLGLVTLASASAPAQSVRGQLSERSEATIRIEVSVAPRLAANQASAHDSDSAMHFTTNAPGLRYEVVAQPLPHPAEVGSQIPVGTMRPSPNTLWMVVPD